MFPTKERPENTIKPMFVSGQDAMVQVIHDICGPLLNEQPKSQELHNMRRELPFWAAPFLCGIIFKKFIKLKQKAFLNAFLRVKGISMSCTLKSS